MRLPSVFTDGPRLRVFAAVTIASTAVISFVSIKHLAEHAGFGEFSWLFPLTLDAVAAFGMDLWVRQSPAWRQARALALVAILGSLVANIADHYLTQRSILGAVLGAVPPGMLAALLAVLHRHASGTAMVRSGPDKAIRDAVWSSLSQAPAGRTIGTGPARYMVPVRLWSLDPAADLYGPEVGPMLRNRSAHQQPVRRVQAGAVPVRSAKLREVRSAGPADDVIVKAIRTTYTEAGRWPSKADVMREYKPMGTDRALRLIREAKEMEVS